MAQIKQIHTRTEQMQDTDESHRVKSQGKKVGLQPGLESINGGGQFHMGRQVIPQFRGSC